MSIYLSARAGTRSLGSYSVLATSGTIAAGLAANSPVFAFRWTDGSTQCAIRSVYVVGQTVLGFAAGIETINGFLARGFTAMDTGGTTVTLTGNNAKKRTTLPTSLLGTGMMIANTGTLTAGTRTKDAQPTTQLIGAAPTAATAVMFGRSLIHPLLSDASIEPIILEANEGFIIEASVPITGTWILSVGVDWEELSGV